MEHLKSSHQMCLGVKLSLCLSGDGQTVVYLLEVLWGLRSTGLIFQVHFSEVEEVRDLPGFSGDPLRPTKDCIS